MAYHNKEILSTDPVWLFVIGSVSKLANGSGHIQIHTHTHIYIHIYTTCPSIDLYINI